MDIYSVCNGVVRGNEAIGLMGLKMARGKSGKLPFIKLCFHSSLFSCKVRGRGCNITL